MEAALALLSLGVAGGGVALAFWAARWARAQGEALAAAQQISDDRRRRVDVLGNEVDARDRAISKLEDELDRARAARAAADRQRADAVVLLGEIAAKSPAALGPAVRAQLERLRALAVTVPPLPAAAPAAAAGAGGGPGPVHGAPAGGGPPRP